MPFSPRFSCAHVLYTVVGQLASLARISLCSDICLLSFAGTIANVLSGYSCGLDLHMGMGVVVAAADG